MDVRKDLNSIASLLEQLRQNNAAIMLDRVSVAVAELVAAATDLQDAMDEHDASPFDIVPSKRFIAADARHRAALANIGETK